MRLTELAIRHLPFQEKGQKRIRDDALPGFGITVGKRSKTFFVMSGEDRRLQTIGRYPDISLRDARDEARKLLAHPAPKRRSVGKNELLKTFLEHCEGTLRPSTVRRYRYSLSKREPETAHDIAAFKAMYNWGLRVGLVSENPYQYRQAIFNERDRLLTDNEIARIWQHDRSPFSDIVKLLILTGQRRGQFGSFDQAWIKGDEIHFPATVMKSKRPHVIPATNTTLDLLKRLQPFNGWGKSKARLNTESGVSDWVLHDLRRFFSTNMARLGVPLHITEHLLDHRSSTSGVQAIYMRYGFIPEMRDALDRYEEHLQSILP